MKILLFPTSRFAGDKYVTTLAACPLNRKPMKHYIQHDLPKEKAREAANQALATYQERFAKYDPQGEWVTEDRAEVTFRAKGFTMKGVFELEDGRIAMDLDVPLIFRPLKGRAIKVVEEEVNRWIDRARQEELEATN